MEVPQHIEQFRGSDLEDWVLHTPEHNPTPLEIYLVTHDYIPITELELKIEELEEDLIETQNRRDEVESEVEDLLSDLKNKEDEIEELAKELEELNVVFPEDMLSFCKEVHKQQKVIAKTYKALCERSSESINLETERNFTQKEVLDLRLQVKIMNAAGIETPDVT